MKYISGIYGLFKGSHRSYAGFLCIILQEIFGLAIIGVTILMKIILLPLTLKQDKSMKSMKKLQPELDKLKEKYKGDPKMLNQKTMELYQQHKVNPAGGMSSSIGSITNIMGVVWSIKRWNCTSRFNILMDGTC